MVQLERRIVHMDLDSFFVSVERLRDSRLEGKPIIVGGTSDRGVVAACSYETRHFGVHSAMPIRLARRLCPHAIIMKGDHEAYSSYSHMVTDIIAEKVPVYEKSSIDEFYIDMSGMDRFYGCYSYATELRRTITKETGLPISFGLSNSKTVSKIGTNEAKPNGQIQIAQGGEKSFLAPLSVKKIPMIGNATYRLLRGMGIAKILTLQEMQPELMERVMGKNGLVIWKKANAMDSTAVVPYSEAKSISTERTFDKDTIDVTRLKEILLGMVEKVAFRLRKKQKLTACITVKIRYSNFDTVSRQCRIPYTSLDHTLIARAYELFDKLYDRRLLIRLIGVRLSHLVGGAYQINIFDDTPTMISLYQAIDKMKLRFGEDAVMRAVGSS
ncbi:MAG: DNA polymerase IV [Flavobacteriaceae bacterium]|nr:DNA polymerase IV [Flavobacteriaceae bacterium]